jgi:hypothetical protein
LAPATLGVLATSRVICDPGKHFGPKPNNALRREMDLAGEAAPTDELINGRFAQARQGDDVAENK